MEAMNAEALERLEELAAHLKRSRELLASTVALSYQRADEIERLRAEVERLEEVVRVKAEIIDYLQADLPRQQAEATRLERDRLREALEEAANFAGRIAEMRERGAGLGNGPGSRLRQVEQHIREALASTTPPRAP